MPEDDRSALKEILAGTGDPALDVAALEMARIAFPHLDITPFLEILDSYAREIDSLAGHDAEPKAFIAAANRVLFEQEGFTGNEQDYYHPHNSCLNEVLANRRGIPITLSLIYMEIARRLERPVLGIGLPGHFLVQYDDGRYSAFIDPYHKGQTLTVEECRKRALHSAHVDILKDPNALAPVGKRQLLIRMLNNLRNAYYRLQEFDKAIEIHSLLIETDPQAAAEYKQRAVLYLQNARYRAALADLTVYLTLAPEATDRPAVEAQIKELRQYLRTLN
jgi:regulator of sirC expression with transglutaminase-like and TPR domain